MKIEELDKDFLKQITVLYVEDDIDTRKEIAEIFRNFFKEVLEANHGDQALYIYEDYMDNNKHIDVIVSDINMPNKNGIELLEDIRKFSDNIPFIFTSAYSDSPVLLDAIKYKVTSYILKPIDMKKLVLEIQEYTKKTFEENRFNIERNELHKYLDNIDKVAIILKSDSNGNIIYANSAFYEISKYNQEDIIGKHYDSVNNTDVSKELLDEMWHDVKDGRIWRGKLKSKNKDDFAYYINTTTIPIYDEDKNEIVEYYHIGFSITQEELEKRVFKKQVMTNVKDNRRENNVARKMIDDLKEQLEKYKDVDNVYESLKQEREKNKKYLTQLKFYAKKVNDIGGF